MGDRLTDLESHHIEGYARAAVEAGEDGRFDVPLISHIEGNLWTGGCIDGAVLSDDFRNVISLYPWERFQLGPRTRRIEVRLYDAAEMPDPDVLEDLADRAVSLLDEGKLLIHCQAGLNRSSLLAALVLRRLGHTSAEAIALLRERRCPVVLCNQTFERYLLELDEQPQASSAP